jgi:hypothetical protein
MFFLLSLVVFLFWAGDANTAMVATTNKLGRHNPTFLGRSRNYPAESSRNKTQYAEPKRSCVQIIVTQTAL